MDESTPPERNAPSGTSATMRRRTASVSRASRPSTASHVVYTVSGLSTRPGHVIEPPVGLDHRCGVLADVQKTSRRELEHVSIDRMRTRDVVVSHIGGERPSIELRRPAGVRAKRLQLRAEDEQSVEQSPVERLDAEAIAHEPQPALPDVPEGHGEHADETPDRDLYTPLPTGLDDDLRIRVTRKAPSGGLQLGSQLMRVVNLRRCSR